MSKRNIEVSEERLVEEGEVAGDYLEQFLDILDFDGDIDLDVEGDRAVVSIVGGDDLDTLVGSDGSVLDACGDHQWVTWQHRDRKQWNRYPRGSVLPSGRGAPGRSEDDSLGKRRADSRAARPPACGSGAPW